MKFSQNITSFIVCTTGMNAWNLLSPVIGYPHCIGCCVLAVPFDERYKMLCFVSNKLQKILKSAS